MKKIGIVLASYPAYSETFLISKIKGLILGGAKVILFAPTNGREKLKIKHLKCSIPYSVNGGNIIQTLKTAAITSATILTHPFRTARLINEESADGASWQEIIKTIYLNAHILRYRLDWLYFGFATMGLNHENVAKAVGAKSAMSFRGYDISIYPLTHPGCYSRLFHKIDKVHSISQDLYNEAIALGLDEKKEFEIIPPAIDTSKFIPKLDYEMGDVVRIVSVGRLTWKKGYEYALSALSKISRPFKFALIGAGEDEERLKYAAYQLGMSDKVEFLGKQSHEAISEYLRNADIYLQPSVQEGFCNSVLEAQACGLICIVSDAQGLAENVENEKSGFVVQARNESALADAIIRVVNMTPQARETMGRYASQRVRMRFDINDQVNKFLKFYEII